MSGQFRHFVCSPQIPAKWIALGMTLSIVPLTDAHAQDGGLSGPSSVAAELTPGDGLTDPQFRSDFPRNVAPAWFSWKEMLAEDYGISFNLDYLSLGQWSNADMGEGRAGGGMARFYGSWSFTDNGTLTFKVENRARTASRSSACAAELPCDRRFRLKGG